MKYSKISVEFKERFIELTLNNPARNNALDSQMTEEMNHFFSLELPTRKETVVLIKGSGGFFCNGMDLAEAVEVFKKFPDPSGEAARLSESYSRLLQNIQGCPKITVCSVDGSVKAGGMGLIAAADFVLATKASVFSLPEILFGLLPANVLPFLTRKIGPAKAYRLTVLHETMTAERAHDLGLVDEVIDDLNEGFRKQLVKFARIDPSTLQALKKLMNEISPISKGSLGAAQDCFTQLISDGKTIEKIRSFLETQKS